MTNVVGKIPKNERAGSIPGDRPVLLSEIIINPVIVDCLSLTGGTVTGNVNINGIESIQPVTGVTQITNGATVTTTDATVTTLQTIAITSNTVVGLESTITYKKLSGVGVGAVGDGTVIKLNTAVNNKAGVNVLDTIQNSYTGTVNAIVGITVNYTISGSNVLVTVSGALNDVIEWKVITKINS